MSNLTLIQSGSFISDGTNKILDIRTGTNFMTVWNITAITNSTGSVGYVWNWNEGMGGIEYQANAGSTAVMILPRFSDFVPVDSSVTAPGARVAITAGTNATRPVYSTASTTGLSTDSMVYLSNLTGQMNLASYPISIDSVVTNTSFRVKYVLANAPGAVATAGFYRIIPFNPIFYPVRRFIFNITQAAQAQVTTSRSHGYTVGQAVRFRMWPDENNFGMNEIDGLIGNITSIVDEGNFTVDIDTRSFTAFTFPTAAAYPFTRAQCAPVGEEANADNSDPNLLGDATVNTAILGMKLIAGADSPAGQNGDVIYWQAGRTENFDL